MPKPFVIAAGLLVILGGCQSKSPTWQKVIATSKAVGDAEDAPRAYAGELHRTLAEAGVPHKVVTFDFVYRGKYDPFMTTRRTAVIYQDSASIKHPWWLMDQTLDRPVWLPTGSVEHQVSFYVRREATVVDVNDYSGADDKDIRPEERPRRPVATSRIEPVKPVVTTRPVQPVQPVRPARVEVVEPAPKRPGFFQRGIFAPRARQTQPEAAAKPVAKPQATSSIQPVKGAKPAQTVKSPSAEATPEKKAPATSSKAVPAPQPKAAEPAKAKPEAAPAKNDPKPPKIEAGPVKEEAPKGTSNPGNRSEPQKAPAPATPESRQASVAHQAVPKSGVTPKAAPLYHQPADRPKEKPVAPDEKPKPKVRKPLITQPAGSAQAEKPGLLRRILSGLNPRRLFTRA